jgi:hypothetical protein
MGSCASAAPPSSSLRPTHMAVQKQSQSPPPLSRAIPARTSGGHFDGYTHLHLVQSWEPVKGRPGQRSVSSALGLMISMNSLTVSPLFRLHIDCCCGICSIGAGDSVAPEDRKEESGCPASLGTRLCVTARFAFCAPNVELRATYHVELLLAAGLQPSARSGERASHPQFPGGTPCDEPALPQ